MNHKYICHISNIRYVDTLKYQIHDMLTTCGKFEATIGSTQSEDLDTLSCPTSLCTSARCLSQVSVNQKNQKKVWIVDFKCTYSKSKKCKKHQNSVHTGHITNPHWGVVVGYDLNIYQWPFEAAITWQNSATHEALKGHGRCACTSAERCGVPCPGTMERTRQWRFHTHPEYVAYISETTSNPSVSPMSRLFSTTPFVTFWTYQITTRSQTLLNSHPKSNSSSWTLFFLKISLSLDMYTGCCCKIQRSSWNSYFGWFFCLGNFGSQKPFSGCNMGSCPQSSAVSSWCQCLSSPRDSQHHSRNRGRNLDVLKRWMEMKQSSLALTSRENVTSEWQLYIGRPRGEI